MISSYKTGERGDGEREGETEGGRQTERALEAEGEALQLEASLPFSPSTRGVKEGNCQILRDTAALYADENDDAGLGERNT